jgi:AraC family transcriptional regulator of adaptative response/methylated-DNA-[protein]-cysteine methyltransferase
LCFVAVGTDEQELLAELRREFPHAAIDARRSAALDPLLREACQVAEGQPLTGPIPVDIRGTAFQWRVWRALTQIPAGQTRTYTEVAQDIGAPTAVRAVARACATNPLALVVPCHRVIGAGGQLRGYRWGLAVKDTLIGAERRLAQTAGGREPGKA